MIPIRDRQDHVSVPLVTWTLIGLNVLLFLWDRQGALTGPGVVFADLAMRPKELLAVLAGESTERVKLVTAFTSMFLHANLLHLIGNLLFLLVFGHGVETALGSVRFAFYYLAWGVLAVAAHVYVNPGSDIPTVGASGAIGGVLGAYLLLFPSNRIEFVVPPLLFLPFTVSAWVLLGVWFAFQLFLPQEGVANWAHVGGFLAGMLTVLVLGGRSAMIRRSDPVSDSTGSE